MLPGLLLTVLLLALGATLFVSKKSSGRAPLQLVLIAATLPTAAWWMFASAEKTKGMNEVLTAQKAAGYVLGKEAASRLDEGTTLLVLTSSHRGWKIDTDMIVQGIREAIEKRNITLETLDITTLEGGEEGFVEGSRLLTSLAGTSPRADAIICTVPFHGNFAGAWPDLPPVHATLSEETNNWPVFLKRRKLDSVVLLGSKVNFDLGPDPDAYEQEFLRHFTLVNRDNLAEHQP